MRASLKSAKNCAFSCVSFLDFLLYIASLPDLNFFLSLPSWMCDFFRFLISIFRRRVVIFIPSIFCLGSMWSSWFLWRLVLQRTLCIWYVPYVYDTYAGGPPFFMFCLRCRWMCFSHRVYHVLLVLFFHRGISSTPELLEPVLRPRTALHCGDELMW